MQCAGECRRRSCGVQNPVVIVTTRDRKLCVSPPQSVSDTLGARELEWRTAHGAKLAGVAISLDRMERGTGTRSAVQEVESQYSVPVVRIATAEDLLHYIAGESGLRKYLPDIEAYRRDFGVSTHV